MRDSAGRRSNSRRRSPIATGPQTAGRSRANRELTSASYRRRQRTLEFAIRLTLGAQPAAVGGRVVGHSLVLVTAGLAIGLVLVRLGHSSLQRVLFEVLPRDVRSTAAAAAARVVAATVACVPPTLRAMRVDPVKGLRME